MVVEGELIVSGELKREDGWIVAGRDPEALSVERVVVDGENVTDSCRAFNLRSSEAVLYALRDGRPYLEGDGTVATRRATLGGVVWLPTMKLEQVQELTGP